MFFGEYLPGGDIFLPVRARRKHLRAGEARQHVSGHPHRRKPLLGGHAVDKEPQHRQHRIPVLLWELFQLAQELSFPLAVQSALPVCLSFWFMVLPSLLLTMRLLCSGSSTLSAPIL